MKQNKISYLDGLRGIAALIVCISHFINAFYPNFGVDINGTDDVPFANLICSGNFSVCIFFVLSGFVLSNKFFKTFDLEIIYSLAIKRYFRLMIPVFFAVLMAYFAAKLSLFVNHEASTVTKSTWYSKFYSFDPNITDALYEGFIGVFIQGYSLYNFSLWTMKIELIGSFLILYLCLMMYFLDKKIAFTPLRLLLYPIMLNLAWDSYYMCLIIGMMLSDFEVIFVKMKNHINFNCNNSIKKISWISFSIALFFGTYSEAHLLHNCYYGSIFEYMEFPWIRAHFLSYANIYHSIGAGLLLFSVLSNESIQNFLSHRICIYLGEISFSLYLLHGILLCSLSAKIFLILISYLSYDLACFFVFILTIFASIFTSHFYAIYIDKKAVNFSNKFYNNIKDLFLAKDSPSFQKNL